MSTGPRRPALLPFWLAVVCLLWSLGVCAQPAPLQIGSAPQYPLSRAFSYLDDSTAALTLQDVLAPANQARFVPVTQVEATTNFGATRSAIWLRGTTARYRGCACTMAAGNSQSGARPAGPLRFLWGERL